MAVGIVNGSIMPPLCFSYLIVVYKALCGEFAYLRMSVYRKLDQAILRQKHYRERYRNGSKTCHLPCELICSVRCPFYNYFNHPRVDNGPEAYTVKITLKQTTLYNNTFTVKHKINDY